jgi:hypothetical protein
MKTQGFLRFDHLVAKGLLIGFRNLLKEVGSVTQSYPLNATRYTLK